jgi:hypothetical protein
MEPPLRVHLESLAPTVSPCSRSSWPGGREVRLAGEVRAVMCLSAFEPLWRPQRGFSTHPTVRWNAVDGREGIRCQCPGTISGRRKAGNITWNSRKSQPKNETGIRMKRMAPSPSSSSSPSAINISDRASRRPIRPRLGSSGRAPQCLAESGTGPLGVSLLARRPRQSGPSSAQTPRRQPLKE